MNSYPESSPYNLEIRHQDPTGFPLTPAQITVALYDQDDNLIVNFGNIPFVADAGLTNFVIPGSYNQLSGLVDELRVIQIALKADSGAIYRNRVVYLITAERKLVIMENSFMSLEAADLLTRQMVNVGALTAAVDDVRIAALVEAFNRITQIRLGYSDNTQFVSRFDAICPVRGEVILDASVWKDMTKEAFLALPSNFIAALRKAQILEANEIMSGDDISRRQRAGIISETIGESSIMLRNGVLDHGVSTVALRALSGFIRYNFRVAR